MRTIRWFSGFLGLALTVAGCGSASDEFETTEQGLDHRASQQRASHEVWVIDQSNTTGLAYGGTLHVFAGEAPGRSRRGARAHEVIDLAGATATLCQSLTGSFPVRPHMVFFNSTHTHAITSFVASGHVVIFDARTRTPLACIQTTPGVGGARQAHAAFPSPDDSFILVANQNGKKLERIRTNYATNTFTLDTAAALDLAGCTTPNGQPCQAPVLRPDNAPICPVVAEDGKTAFVTLRGGGLFVVDAAATPIAIVGEYDGATVHGNGCGGLEIRGRMFVNSGGGTPTNLHEFDVYDFPTRGFRAQNPPNTPAPALLFSDHSDDRDAHGMVAVKNERFLWAFDRGTNVFEVFDVRRGSHVGTVDLVAPGLALDPTPDLADISPDGGHVYVSLRGPNPLSGDPHVSTGDSPGVAVLGVTRGGRSADVLEVLPISNLDAGGVQRADPHGLRVRRISRR